MILESFDFFSSEFKSWLFSPGAIDSILPLIVLFVGFVGSWVIFRERKGNGKATDYQNWRNIIAGIAVATLTIVWLQKAEFDEMRESLSIVKSAKTVQVLSDFITARDAAYTKSQVLGDLYDQAFDRFRDSVAAGAQGQFFVSKEDLRNTVAFEMIRDARRSIRATSYLNQYNDFWEGDWKALYVEENRRAIERGVRIERIFIFPDEDALSKNEQLLIDNVNAGVDTRVLLLKDMGSEKVYAQDVINVDGIVGSRLHLDDERGANYQSSQMAEFTTNLQQIDVALDFLERKARPFRCPVDRCSAARIAKPA